MFSIETTIPLLIAIATQSLLLPFQVINYFARNQESFQLRFLLVTLGFLFTNASLLISSIIGKDNIYAFFLIGLSGGFSLFHTLNYISLEFNVRFPRTLAWHLFLLVFFFLIINSISIWSDDLDFLMKLFQALILEMIALRHLWPIIIEIVKKDRKRFSNPSTLLVACLSLILIPLVIYWIRVGSIVILILNLPFFVFAFSHVLKHVLQTRIESSNFYEVDESILIESDTERLNITILSEQEKNVVDLLVKGYLYKEIADKLRITTGAATKHGSNAYAKLGVKNKKELLEILKRK